MCGQAEEEHWHGVRCQGPLQNRHRSADRSPQQAFHRCHHQDAVRTSALLQARVVVQSTASNTEYCIANGHAVVVAQLTMHATYILKLPVGDGGPQQLVRLLVDRGIPLWSRPKWIQPARGNTHESWILATVCCSERQGVLVVHKQFFVQKLPICNKHTALRGTERQQSRICAQAIQTFITIPCSAMFTKLFAIVFAAPHWLGTYCLSSFGKGVRGMGPGRDHSYNHAMVECAHAQPQSVLSSSITSY